MAGFEVPAGYEPLAALLILAAMLVMFVRESYPVEVVALSGAALMLILGLVSESNAMAAFANPAPWTIAALFLIVGGLVRTGALEALSQRALSKASQKPRTTLGILALSVLGMSSVVNNTPVVVVFLPVFVRLAGILKIAPSKLLIPLSYLSILGGMVTLMGTSTNLVVNGAAQAAGLEPFGMFEITALGVPVALVGLLFMGLFANRLLPERDSMASLLSERSAMKFFTEVALPEGSALIGKRVTEAEILTRGGARVIDVLRGDASLRRALGEVVLEAGDRVVLRTQMSEVLGLHASPHVRVADQISSVRTSTVEVLITPDCTMVGRSLGQLRLRRRYGVYPLAVHRRSQNIGRQLDDLVVQVGDTLLLEGAMEDIRRLASDVNLVNIAEPTERAFRRSHAPIVLAVLAGVVGLAALDVASIQALALVGVVIILLTRCIDADEAFGYIDGRLLAMIFALLVVGAGLEESGAVDLVVTWMTPHLRGLPGWMLLVAVYAVAMVLTEMISNNAVGLILTPLVISLGQNLGVDPRPLVVTVMFAASVAFASPIGYQTHTLVYGPGGYRFTDFLRIGVPMNLLMMATVCLLVPLIWPL